MLVYFFWEKGKVITTVSRAVREPGGFVHSVSFHPKDRDIVCIVGKNVFKMCKLIEGNLKPFGFTKGDILNCHCHAWYTPKHLLVVTEAGKVLLFEEAEMRTSYCVGDLVQEVDSDVTEEEAARQREISALICYSGGFICSYGNNAVYVLEQQPLEGSEELQFRAVKKIIFPKRIIAKDGLPGYDVRSLCINPSEEQLVALTDDLLLFSYPLNKKENSPLKKNLFSIVLHPFHSAAITGLDICQRKPLVVTGAADMTIRVWNYRSPGLELAKRFREEIHSLAIHPDGLYIAAGFQDKIRFLNILIDDMRIFHEFPVREARVCLFSHGGHLLVAAVRDTILVFNTISFRTVHTLAGHQGEVTALCWAQDDLKLVSCADNGSVYEWDVASGERVHEV